MNAIDQLTQTIRQALATYDAATAAPPPPAPPPGPPPTPAPQPVHLAPIFAFTDPASPHDPVAGKLIYNVTWRDIEPTEGVFDFTGIERQAQPWVDAGKQIAVRFMHVLEGGNLGTPDFVLARCGKIGTVANYFAPGYAEARAAFMDAVRGWLQSYAHGDRLAWIEWGTGIDGETKIDSEQGHTIDLVAWKAAGYSDRVWHDLVVGEATEAVAKFAGHTTVVINMDRSFVGGDPAFTAAGLGADLRKVGAILGDHGYRQGQVPSSQFTSGPTVYEQWKSTATTGNNANTEVAEMLHYADMHGGAVLIYGSDIPRASPTLTAALGAH